MTKYTKADLLELEMKNLIKQNGDDHKVILEQIKSINKKLDESFVTKDEFDPVRNVVYGLVGMLLVAVLGAIVKLVIIQ
jgi:hypothetical protein